jgi:DNA modification methylase
VRQTETLGWTDCGHNTWRTGTVLDPFGGSGTTLAVATGHSRNAIGIDLDVRNAELACDRIGPMFFHHTTVDELWPLDGAA